MESRTLSVGINFGSQSDVCSESGTPVHILEYENYKGYDMTTKKIRESDVSKSPFL